MNKSAHTVIMVTYQNATIILHVDVNNGGVGLALLYYMISCSIFFLSWCIMYYGVSITNCSRKEASDFFYLSLVLARLEYHFLLLHSYRALASQNLIQPLSFKLPYHKQHFKLLFQKGYYVFVYSLILFFCMEIAHK